MDWIREHFALLMLIGVVSLMLIGALAVHFPSDSDQADTCPPGQLDCISAPEQTAL